MIYIYIICIYITYTYIYIYIYVYIYVYIYLIEYLMTYPQSVKCLLMERHFFQKWKIPAYLFDLNYELETINQWFHLWKMPFNLYRNK